MRFSDGSADVCSSDLCAAAANANLDIVDAEDLAGNARDTGGYFQRRLHETFDAHPMVGEVRGVGLLAAIEFAPGKTGDARFDPASKVGPKVAAAALPDGLIARAMPQGDLSSEEHQSEHQSR